jgi:hypothetical protein
VYVITAAGKALASVTDASCWDMGSSQWQMHSSDLSGQLMDSTCAWWPVVSSNTCFNQVPGPQPGGKQCLWRTQAE